jgi:hypothetical protein
MPTEFFKYIHDSSSEQVINQMFAFECVDGEEG